jgi:protein import protein ZIM17
MQCAFCRHLIADNLGWFKDDTKEGRMRTVEDFMRAKGEKVRRGKLHNDGDIEYVED